jgi:hypothetical protein
MLPALDVLEAELLATGRSTEPVQRMRGAYVGESRPSRGRTSGERRDGVRERRGARSAQ